MSTTADGVVPLATLLAADAPAPFTADTRYAYAVCGRAVASL